MAGAHTLMAELLYDAPTALDPERLLADVRRSLPDSELAAGGGPSGPMLVHPRFTHTFADGKRMPILTTFMRPDSGSGPAGAADLDLSQTWNWPDAADALARWTTTIGIAELMGRTHEPHDRVTAFRTCLLAAVSQTSPVATWWPLSTQVVRPDELWRHELVGIVNVRLFRVENDPGVVVMDTLGLHVLGLPDLQCRFSALDTTAMAEVLYNTAAYLYERGDVIQDGNTITGLHPDDRWPCHHTQSLVPPSRETLTITTVSA